MSETVQTGRLIPYLVEMFRYQSMLSLGKIANPMTQKVERDLPSARVAIDMLSELEARTEGHRSADESRLLQGALTDLRLNYLDEMKKPQPANQDSEPGEKESGESASDSDSDQPEDAEAKG